MTLVGFFVIAILVSGLSGLSGTPALAKEHDLSEAMPGLKSPYSDSLIAIEKLWAANSEPKYLQKLLTKKTKLGTALGCYRDSTDPFYIGVGQQATIQAPIDDVYRLIADFTSTNDLYDGLEQTAIRETSENLYLIFSEQYVPFPFVANDRSEIYYQLNSSGIEAHKRYFSRYQLKSSNHLKFEDGLIVLEQTSPKLTTLYELDFFNADWGIAKTLAPSRIWRDSVRGLVQAVLAIKLKSEDASAKNTEIRKKSLEQSEALDLTACLDQPEAFN